jgi:ribonuclease D
MELSEYELEREERIKKNAIKLKSLDFHDKIKKKKATLTTKSKQCTRSLKAQPTVVRRSERMGDVKYIHHHIRKATEENTQPLSERRSKNANVKDVSVDFITTGKTLPINPNVFHT